MKLTSLAVLYLSILLVHTHLSLAKRGGGFGKKGSSSRRTSSRGSSSIYNRGNQGTGSQGGYPQSGGYPSQGRYPQQPGRSGYPSQGYPYQWGYPIQGGYPNQGGYPQQPGRPGYPNQGYPNQGGYPNQWGYYPQHPGKYPGQGYPYGGGGAAGSSAGYGYGGYPGRYINHNPRNQILSPRLGGTYGYGGYGGDGGSPFVHLVQRMGLGPSMKSKAFGWRAAMATGPEAVAGMALGYGLGRFPRPHFHFHSPQEEYYYNYYMYKKYGTKSTDTNDYSRDYKFSPPAMTYDNFMEACMKRSDLLPGENQQGKTQPITTSTTTSTTTTTTTTTTVVSSDPDNNTSEINSTAADESPTPGPSPSTRPNQPEAKPLPPASQHANSDDNDDDAVSIVEIGYPALIEQLKARRCVGLYMEYAARYLQKQIRPPLENTEEPKTTVSTDMLADPTQVIKDRQVEELRDKAPVVTDKPLSPAEVLQTWIAWLNSKFSDRCVPEEQDECQRRVKRSRRLLAGSKGT